LRPLENYRSGDWSLINGLHKRRGGEQISAVYSGVGVGRGGGGGVSGLRKKVGEKNSHEDYHESRTIKD